METNVNKQPEINTPNLSPIINKEEINTSHGNTPVTALCYSPDGKFIIGVHGNQITMWDAASGRKLRTFLAKNKFVSVAYNPKKKHIAVGDVNGTISIYNESGKWIKEMSE